MPPITSTIGPSVCGAAGAGAGAGATCATAGAAAIVKTVTVVDRRLRIIVFIPVA
jgi:hypothetical protein